MAKKLTERQLLELALKKLGISKEALEKEATAHLKASEKEARKTFAIKPFKGKDKDGFTFPASRHFAKREKMAKEMRAVNKKAKELLAYGERQRDRLAKKGERWLETKAYQKWRAKYDKALTKSDKLYKDYQKLKKISKKFAKQGQTYTNWRRLQDPKKIQKAQKEAQNRTNEVNLDKVMKLMRTLDIDCIEDLVEALLDLADGDYNFTSEQINEIRQILGLQGGQITSPHNAQIIREFALKLKAQREGEEE